MAKDAASLLAQANCYACFGGGGTFRLMELMLYQHWNSQATGAVMLPATTAWVARAQANGGNPSQNSITAVNTFWNAMITAGIDGKMCHLNPIAPDDLPTARTPYVVGTGGLNMWGDPSGNLVPQQNTLNLGLKGDASYRSGSYWDTGVVPNLTQMNGQSLNAGVSIYVSVQEPDGTNHVHGGCDNTPTSQDQFKLIYDFEQSAFNAQAPPNGVAAAFSATGVPQFYPFSGFISFNLEPSGPSWNCGVYGRANNVFFYHTFTNVPLTNYGGLVPAGNPIGTKSFGFLDNHGNPEPSAETLSFAAFHLGLTFSQSTALFNAVQAMRVAFGSGYV